MQVNAIEIINIIIVLFCIIAIFKNNDITSLFIILFFYGALHFSFAVVLFATHNPANELAAIHAEGQGAGIISRVSALLLLGIVLVSVSLKAIASWKTKTRGNLKVEFYILSVMLAILIAYLFDNNHDDFLQLKNVISIEIMLAIILTGYGASTDDMDSSAFTFTDNQIRSVLLILIVAIFLGFYEVFNQFAWGLSPGHTGEMVYRASAFLFNPNLFSFWAVLVYLGFAFGLSVRKDRQTMMMLGMILASIAIYLSGSRSGGYLLFGLLFIPLLFIKDRSRWIPLIILPFSMFTIYMTVTLIIEPFISSNTGWHKVALLGERFAVAPLYLVNYILSLGFVSNDYVSEFSKYVSALSASESANYSSIANTSIEGRMWGKGVDSGWIVLYQDVGWVGVIAMSWFFFMLFFWSARAYLSTKSVASVYALVLLFCCLIIGFVLRLQVFPVWLFFAVMLTPCLVFWHRTNTSNTVVVV